MTAFVPDINTGRGAYDSTVGARSLVGRMESQNDWVRARFYLSVLVLLNEGMEVRLARAVSAMACILWAEETGWGAFEHRGNVSNIGCTVSATDTGCCVRLGTGTGGEVVRAYYCGTDATVARNTAPQAGIAAFWRFIRRDYPLAWSFYQRAALNGPWETYRGGWATQPPSRAEIDSIWRRVRAALLADHAPDVPPGEWAVGTLEEGGDGSGADGGGDGSELDTSAEDAAYDSEGGDSGDGGGGVDAMIGIGVAVAVLSSMGDER